MNNDVALAILAYIAVGGMTKIMTSPYPATVGERWATVFKILVGALLVGGLVRQLPVGVSVWFVIAVFSIPFLGDVAGLVVGGWIDQYRVWIDGKRIEDADTSERGRTEGEGAERGHNMEPGTGEKGHLNGEPDAIPGDRRTRPSEVSEGDAGSTNGNK